MAEGSEGTRRGHTTVARLLCESAVIHRWPLRRSRGQSSRCLVGQDQDMLYCMQAPGFGCRVNRWPTH